MSGNNLTYETAGNLRELALSVPEGQFLGTEKDLLARFGVSRPTFRQAVHIIESERIIAKVRGLNGGLFSRRPDLEGVVASAATYLRSRETTLGDILIAADSAVADAISRAATCTDEVLRAELDAMIQILAASELGKQSVADFRRDELDAIHLICRMCGNPALELIIHVLYQVGQPAFEEMFEGNEVLMSQRRTSRVMLLRAIHAREGERAHKISRRSGDQAGKQVTSIVLGRGLRPTHSARSEN